MRFKEKEVIIEENEGTPVSIDDSNRYTNEANVVPIKKEDKDLVSDLNIDKL